MKTRTHRKASRGLGLLEVVVALGLLAAGMLAMVDLFPVAYEVADRGRDELLATHVAQSYLDTECSKDFYTMADGQYTDTHVLNLDGSPIPHTFDTFLTVTPLGADKVKVTAQVQWRKKSLIQGDNLRYLQMETIRTREF